MRPSKGTIWLKALRLDCQMRSAQGRNLRGGQESGSEGASLFCQGA